MVPPSIYLHISSHAAAHTCFVPQLCPILKTVNAFSRQDSVGLSYSEVEHLISSLDEITDYLTQHLAELDNEVIIEINNNNNNNNNNSGVCKCVSLLIMLLDIHLADLDNEVLFVCLI